jgi:phospholipid/cholesterol/gamma-HCH transport system substrate-binding protein
MIISILPGNGKEPPVEPWNSFFQSHPHRWPLKTLSKTNENAAHLTENLLTITEKINDGKGTVGLLLNDAEVARDLKKSCIT